MSKQARFIWTLVAASCLILTIGCASTRSAGEQIDDAGITTKVTAKLTADPEINPFKIDVDTIDGVVTLRGKVKDEAVKMEAEKLARKTSGVKSVRNEIRVVTMEMEDEDGNVVTDAWITTKVKSKLTADPQLNPFNIDVDTQDGEVTLSGVVRTQTAKQEAEKLARDTKGVKRVNNELQVRKS